MEDSELLDRVVGVRGCEAVKAEVSAVHSSSHVESFGGKKYGGACFLLLLGFNRQ
jgi:hypothetical protein